MANVVLMSEDQAPYGNSYPYLGGDHLVNEPMAEYATRSRIQLIRRGLPQNSLNFLLKKTKLTRQELGTILQISPRTMQRYGIDQMLPSVVSEKLLALNDLFEKAEEVLGGGPANVTDWLRQEVIALGNQRPIDLLDTYQGLNEVMKVLGRMEWGVAS